MRGVQAGAAGWASHALSGPHSSPLLQEGGLGGAPQPGHSAPSGLPFICWLCHFLSIADPFSVPSVISNNVTASLESIHQSRKKPMLTLIKKKKKKNHLCLPGKSSQPNRWCPPPACHFMGAPRGNQIPPEGGRVPSHRWCPHSQAHSPKPGGRRSLKEVSTLGSFQLAEEPDLAIYVCLLIGFSLLVDSILKTGYFMQKSRFCILLKNWIGRFGDSGPTTHRATNGWSSGWGPHVLPQTDLTPLPWLWRFADLRPPSGQISLEGC